MKALPTIMRRIQTPTAHLYAISIRSLAIVATMAVFVPDDLIAQEKVGTAFVDGQRVELFADGSWRYSGPSVSNGCITIKLNVDFCGQEFGWRQTKNNDPEITAIFMFNDRNHGLFIIEQLGLVDGVSSEFMMLTAIENFASGSGVRAEDIVVFSVEDGMFNDLPSATITYGGALENINVIFRNTIVIDENLTMQAATYTIGAEVTDSFERLHDGFLDAIVLN